MTTKPAAGEPKLARTSRGRSLKRIGKYEIHGEVGRGSFGRVYKGFDPFVQREVAIKVAEVRDGAATQHDAFFVEARAAGKLNHPSIVTLYDAGIEDTLSYIVMEFIEGETLKRYCSKDSMRPRFERVAEIAAKCSLALDYIHRLGVLHKDIKPSNIMVTRDGRPKIMDFSIAAMAGAEGATIAGSPMYMSPEQITGRTLGPPADLYSLGTVLFQLLSGQPPFSARETRLLFEQIKFQPAPSLKVVRPDLPDPLCEIVDRLLKKDPKERYATGRQLAADLTPFADSSGPRRKSLSISHDSLRKLRFFGAFKTRELGELMDASETLTLRAGDAIVREGEMDNALYVLLMGLAEVRKNGQLIALLEKGDCFGEIGFLYAVQRTASVLATTDVLVLKINSELLEKMSEDCQLRYYKIFCENLIVRLTLTTEKAAALLPKSDFALDFLLP